MKISQTTKPVYKCDGKVTTCIIDFDPNKIENFVRTGTKKNFLTDFSKLKKLNLIGKGSATLSDGDEFSEVIGNKIALQRAKIDLISKVKSYYKLELDAIGTQAETMNDIMDFLRDEQDRCRSVINENK